mmetsp:Transcript_6101/g.20727  ORF Transcript_6101/g.20727 Transcript_6101/m.20727 type:complete len:444 (+) Transcript_6101:1386-2717(+)
MVRAIRGVDDAWTMTADDDPRRVCSINAREFSCEPSTLRRRGRKINFSVDAHHANRSERDGEPIGVDALTRRRKQRRRGYAAFTAAIVASEYIGHAIGRAEPCVRRRVELVVAHVCQEWNARRPILNLRRPFVPNRREADGVGEIAKQKRGVDFTVARVGAQRTADVQGRSAVAVPRERIVIRAATHVGKHRNRHRRVGIFSHGHGHLVSRPRRVDVVADVILHDGARRSDDVRGVHESRMSIAKSGSHASAQISRIVRRRHRSHAHDVAADIVVDDSIRQRRAVRRVTTRLPRHARRRSSPTRRQRHARPHRRQRAVDRHRIAPRDHRRVFNIRRVDAVVVRHRRRRKQHEIIRLRAVRRQPKPHARRAARDVRRIDIHEHGVLHRRRRRDIRARGRIRREPMRRQRRRVRTRTRRRHAHVHDVARVDARPRRRHHERTRRP